MLPYLVAAPIVGALAIYVSRHRDTAVGRPFTLVMSAVAVWIFLEGLLVLGTDLQTKYILGKTCYPAVVAIGPALLMAALRSNNPSAKLHPLMRIAVYSVPVLTLFVLMFDSVPGLLYANIAIDNTGPYPKRVFARGPWYWILTAHSYLLIAWASYLLLRRVRATWDENGSDAPVILIGISVPWLTSTRTRSPDRSSPPHRRCAVRIHGDGLLFRLGIQAVRHARRHGGWPPPRDRCDERRRDRRRYASQAHRPQRLCSSHSGPRIGGDQRTADL